MTARATTLKTEKGTDRAHNIGNYEAPQGKINEYEFQQSHGAMTEEERDRFARQEDEKRLREGEAKANDKARDNQENELEAEQESAAAMDSDVPQPDGADDTTEGQPS